MSNKDEARRADVEVSLDGADITASLLPFFISLTYTDSEEGEADDLQIKLQDRDEIWLSAWMGPVMLADGAKHLDIKATIIRRNWWGDGSDSKLDCGKFELDSFETSGPPSVITLKATSLPYSGIRGENKSKSWEGYTLPGIAGEIAANAGMELMYRSSNIPSYERTEQSKQSDILFLKKLCDDAGISLKATDGKLVLFDQAEFEAAEPVITIERGKTPYTKYKLSTGSAGTEYHICRVSYTDPVGGSKIEGFAYSESYDPEAEENKTLEVTLPVSSIGEAEAQAAKQLRLRNKFERTASFTFAGEVGLAAGVVVALKGWGLWDGKYLVRQAKHTVSTGYTTTIELRRVLEGY